MSLNQTSSQGVALITGASSGIGAVYADRLAKRGYDLVLVARSQDRLEALARQITSNTGRSVEVLSADLTERADLRKLEARLVADASITVLVNNAGLGATATLIDSEPDAIESMITLNVVALTRLSQAIVPGFVARGSGTVINIASIAALAPEILNGSYSGTKAYVVNFTQSMAHELTGKGVRVQAVLPGAIRTAFWDAAGVPVQHLPQEIVMSAEDLVDAALVGLDLGELITIPSLPDIADWHRLESARLALTPNLSHVKPAVRYAAAMANG